MIVESTIPSAPVGASELVCGVAAAAAAAAAPSTSSSSSSSSSLPTPPSVPPASASSPPSSSSTCGAAAAAATSSSLMSGAGGSAMNDLMIEVCVGDDVHTWYKALLEDFDNEGVLVRFLDTRVRPPTAKIAFDMVRRVPRGGSNERIILQAGDKCQVYCSKRGSEQEPEAWHDATIKVVRGDFYMFEYAASADRQSDVMSAELFRRSNSDANSKLDKSHLYKYSFPVAEPIPEDMGDLTNHEMLKNRLKSSKLYYDCMKHELVMISDSDENVRLFHMFVEFHLKFLRQKAAFKKSIDIATKRVAALKAPKESNLGAGHVETFSIKEGLMGLAIGASGSNISMARNVPGIKHIQTDQDNSIRIYADSLDSAKRARSILEFDEQNIDIPKEKIPRIIGRQGTLIQEMVDRSGVVKVTVEKDNPDPRLSESDPFKRLIVRGTKDSIDNMRILIDYYLEHVEKIDEIVAETNQLQQELRNLTIQHSQTNGPTSSSLLLHAAAAAANNTTTAHGPSMRNASTLYSSAQRNPHQQRPSQQHLNASSSSAANNATGGPAHMRQQQHRNNLRNSHFQTTTAAAATTTNSLAPTAPPLQRRR